MGERVSVTQNALFILTPMQKNMKYRPVMNGTGALLGPPRIAEEEDGDFSFLNSELFYVIIPLVASFMVSFGLGVLSKCFVVPKEKRLDRLTLFQACLSSLVLQSLVSAYTSSETTGYMEICCRNRRHRFDMFWECNIYAGGIAMEGNDLS